MSNDLVINSYEEQIKESLLKAQAVKIAGFDIIIEELKKRSIDCNEVTIFFDKIKNANTIEEINSLTIDDLNEIIENMNTQVTKSLTSAVEVAEHLLRRSREIALEKSPNGKINTSDNYIKVGTNLSNEVQQHGISYGLDICIRNYCIQKMYQASYREKIKERKIKLGIYDENLENITKKNITSKGPNINKTLRSILKKDTVASSDKSFDKIKEDYFNVINNKVSHLGEYK